MNSKQPKSHSFGLLGMEPVNFDEAWIQLESSLLSMLQNVGAGFPNDLWIELVEKVYRVCVGQGESSHLYSKIQEMLLKYNQNKLMELQEFQYSTNHSSLDFLSQYQNAFVNYGTGITFGSHLFSHLDRPWISNNHCDSGRSPMEGVYFVHELALIMWKEVVKSEKNVVFDVLAPYICSSIISVINAAREHNVMDLGDGGILQSVVETYEILGFEKRERSQLFQEHLEDHVIEDTGVYFIRRAMQIIDSMPIGQYMKEAEKILSEEATRNSTFVGPYTAERMFLRAKEGLIFDHSDRLVEEAAKTMLVPSHEKRDDLKRLYRLVACTCYSGGDESRLETNVFGREKFGGNRENEVLDKLLQAVMGHIKHSGMEIVQNVQAQGGLLDLQSSRDHGRRKLAAHEVKKQGVDSNIVVDMIINVYEHYSGMVKECFDDSAAFHSTLDDACRVFVNAIPRVAEWLARYAHHLLDKEFKESRIGEDARSFALDRVGFLFGFITDKDVFHMFYANLLRTRITQLTSQSDESEERMLSNLRKASGFEYTSKLQRMFVDKALSRELHTGYMQWQERLVAMMKLHDPHLPKPGRTMTNGEEEEEQSSSARTIMHTGAAGVNGSALNLSEDVQKASLVGDGHLMSVGDGTISPAPMSPTNMSSSSKGLSPRMNILPSFAWGRTMFRHLRRSPRKSALQSSEAYFGEMCGDGMGDCDLTQNIYGCTNDWGDVMPTFDAFTFVLTAGCWSLQSVKSTFTPPKPIENYIKSFLQFYSESHSGRRLEWLFHLGHGEMYAHGFDKTYCIHSSTFQMGILYQFGHAKRLSVQDIAQSVTIPEKELCRHLYPLIKISWNDITPEHTIVINEKFTSRRILVKIDIVDHSKLSTKEEHSVEEDMAPDRMRSVQAAICRIMKSRKQMEHHSLCTEVQCQLKHLFVPNKAFIKQNVEELISKYYIERVGTEEYKYCS